MVVRVVQQLFAPITLALRNRGAAMTLIEDLGWTLDEQFDLEALAILGPVAAELSELTEVVLAVEAGTREPREVVEEVADLLDAVFVAIEGLQDLAGSDVTNLVAPMNTPEFWEEFALDLPEYLILTYLETYLPLVFALVDLGGVIGTEERPNGRPARRIIDWDALGAFLRDPSNHLQTTYGWGGPLEHALLMPRLRNLMWALNLPATPSAIPGALVAARYGGNEAAARDVTGLAVPLLSAAMSQGGTSASGQVDALLVPVPRAGTVPDGWLDPQRGRGAGCQRASGAGAATVWCNIALCDAKRVSVAIAGRSPARPASLGWQGGWHKGTAAPLRGWRRHRGDRRCAVLWCRC